MRINRTAFLCMVLATMSCVSLTRAQSYPGKSFLDDAEILARWEKTYGRIRSMRVSYRTLLVEFRPPQTPGDDLDEEPRVPLKHSQVERIEQGKRYHVRYSLAEDGLNNSEWLVEFAFDGKITQSYMGSTERGVVSLEQRGGSEETMNMPKEFMFLKNHKAPDVLRDEYPDGVPELARSFRFGKLRGKVVVRPNLEPVVGQSCHVVEISDPNSVRQGKQVYWMAHDKGMCLMKYQMSWSGKLRTEIGIERIAEVDVDGGSLWYPQRAYRTIYSDRFGMSKRELTVTDFVPNVKIDEATFRLSYIEGTHVSDKNSTKSYKWRNGMKFVADGWNNSIRYVPKDWSILVRTGKPLPKFEDVAPGLSADQIEDRSILLCFFDMEQRPSRNCIERLSTKAQELKTEDLLIIAIHASTVDQTRLNEWVKKYNIPFPAGTITADAEKTKFAWGVRSLPWLILTDKKQVVRAEGFGIEELDEELRNTVDTEHATQGNKVTGSKLAAQTYRSEAGKSFLDASEILKAWEDNYAHFASMEVSYTERVLEAIPPADDPNRFDFLVRLMHVERVEQGQRFHIRCSADEEGFNRPDSIIEGSFDGAISREYFGRTRSGTVIAGMKARNTETMNRLKTYMLLDKPRLVRKNPSGPSEVYWIEDPNSKPKLSFRLSSAISVSRVSIEPNLEFVGGQLCHVVEITYKGNIGQIIWLAHKKGMLPLKYQLYGNSGLAFKTQVAQIDSVETDGRTMWYPKKAYLTSIRPNGGRIRYELTTHKFVPNIQVDENTFRFDFPKGTRIYDRVRGIYGVDLPREPPSLVGKALLPLENLSLSFDLDQAKDKMILVCFWDVEQRPSRNCLQQLSTRAPELKAKGMVVVAAQASKIDEDSLGEWVKKYSVPFPVGMIEGDEDKARFTWGVKSLPWLILTDKKHIVRVAGFSLDELDEKIQNEWRSRK